MALKVGELLATIDVDAKPFDRGLDRMDQDVAKVGRSLGDVGSKVAGVGRTMSAVVTLPVAAMFVGVGKAASNLGQSVGAVDQVFGDTAGTIEAFGETADQTAGLSQRQVNEMAATIGASLTGMGFGVDEAAGKVVTLEQRAADMAATFGGSTEQAIQAVGSALRGERDPIERYGVSIKEADVQARILARGLDTSTAAAEKKATAVATLELLLEQTAKTEGQFARESDSAAGAQARATAEIENAAAKLGKNLLPLIADGAEVVGSLADSFGDLPDPAQKAVLAIAGIAALSGPVLTVGGNVLKLGDAFSKVGDKAGKFTAILGPVGIALAAGAVVLNAWNKDKEEGARRTEEFTEALRADSGVIGENTEALILNKLERDDQLDDLARAGVSIAEVTAAVDGETGARDRLILKLKEEGEANFGLVTNLTQMFEASDKAKQVEAARTEVVGKSTAATEDATDATDELTTAYHSNITETITLEERLKAVTTAYGKLIGVNISAEEAAIRLEEEFATLGETIGENGATLDINTEAGRNNRQAILDVTEAAFGSAEAYAEQTGDVAGAKQQIYEHTQRLVDEMVQLGLTEDAAWEYAHQLGLTPKNIETTFQAHTEEATRKLAEYNAMLRRLPTNWRTTLIATEAHHRAAGGPVEGLTPYIVGEQGPELFVPRGSGAIVPNHALDGAPAAVSGQAAADPTTAITVNWHQQAPIYGVDDLKAAIRGAFDRADRERAARVRAGSRV